MKVSDINPFVRFAQCLFYESKPISVNVCDCRIFCVISGAAEIIIENQHYTLTEKTFFYCAAGSTYTISSADGSSILILNFDLDQTKSTETDFKAPLKLSHSQKPCFKNESLIEDCELFNGFFFLEDNVGFYTAVERIIKEFSEKNIFFREKCSSLLKNLMIDIYRMSLKQVKSSSFAVEIAMNYIKSNYHSKITNKEISEITSYHEYHVNRLFERYIGMTIHQYIIEIRLAEAKKLLLNTDMPIYEIAEATGFNSSAHFTTCFKKAAGISPYVYKNNLKNNI